MPKYIIFGHSLHSIFILYLGIPYTPPLQASTCLFELIPSHVTSYPGAPSPTFIFLYWAHHKKGYTYRGITIVMSEIQMT